MNLISGSHDQDLYLNTPAMKGSEFSLALKYFLAWYEFHLVQRHNKEVAFDPAVTENCSSLVRCSSTRGRRPPDTAVGSMRDEVPSEERSEDMARQALLAEMFRRWRRATLKRRHVLTSRLTDPAVITDFVRRLQQRVLGKHSAGNAAELPVPGSVVSCAEPGPGRPQDAAGATLRQSDPQQASPRDPVVTDAGRTPPSGPAAARDPSNRTDSDSGGSIDLCAEIMTTHALRLARRRPMPQTDSEAELRRAPHLHSYLMTAGSNRRRRRPAAGPVPAAPDRPPYQQELERRAEQRRTRQQECRRRRLEREAAGREAERRRHEHFQHQLALEVSAGMRQSTRKCQ